jgi:hypothetical protein
MIKKERNFHAGKHLLINRRVRHFTYTYQGAARRSANRNKRAILASSGDTQKEVRKENYWTYFVRIIINL